jgi:hypothetical protein
MVPQNLRIRVVTEAYQDAAAYYREFRGPVATEDDPWVTEAWGDLKNDLKLAPETAVELWPVYWEAFSPGDEAAGREWWAVGHQGQDLESTIRVNWHQARHNVPTRP